VLLCIELRATCWNGRKCVNAKTDFSLSFDPDAWEYSVVTHTPGSWLPSSIRSRRALNPRAAPALSWSRAARAPKRKRAR